MYVAETGIIFASETSATCRICKSAQRRASFCIAMIYNLMLEQRRPGAKHVMALSASIEWAAGQTMSASKR